MSIESRQRPRKVAKFREGDEAAAQFDSAVQRILTVSKDEIVRRENAEKASRKAKRDRKTA